jgi:hypothetical protein
MRNSGMLTGMSGQQALMSTLNGNAHNLLSLDRNICWRLDAQADVTSRNPDDGHNDLPVNNQPLAFFASEH